MASHANELLPPLRSGEIIIGGGHQEELGVGQTYTLERYDPKTHTFEGFGCLDWKRVLANAMQLADGRVIITGNHYASDAIGCYDGNSQVQHVKDVVQPRSNPHILRTSDDDAIIVGAFDNYDKQLDSVWADRLKGDAFRVPLLDEWQLVYTDVIYTNESCAMGDGAYLLMVKNKGGQLGFVVARDTCFTLLQMECPVPMNCQWGPVRYEGHAVVDSLRRRAYVIGVDSLYSRQYILAIDYARQPARLTLYHADTPEIATPTSAVVTPGGDLIVAGGIAGNNFKPRADVWLYHFGTQPQIANTNLPLWLWLLMCGIGVAALAYIYIHYKQKQTTAKGPSPNDQTTNTPNDQELMQRICQVIEHDQRYLTQRLRLSDIAVELGVSVAVLADCIDRQRHYTFARLIAEYRVNHTQRLLAEQPDMKLSSLIAESGFTSESTFFRTFKAVTGQSPKEWLAQQEAKAIDNTK